MQLSLFLLSAAAMVSAATATDHIDLGTAGDFVILAKSGISTEPSSDVTGNIGVSPIAATAMTGFGMVRDSSKEFSTATQLTGNAYASNYASPTPTKMTTAVSNMETAYSDAAGRPNADDSRINLGGGEIGGETLTPGVYTFGSVISITSDVKVEGGPDDVFIIQTTNNLKQAANTNVVLGGSAKAENIFWQVAGSVEVGAGSVLNGIVLVKTEAVFKTGASLHGRVLTQTACTLDKAVLTQPSSA
jgi:hypothetical protein